MASNYTENYGLCQWEATDQVLRTDFNEDSAKVDEALAQNAQSIEDEVNARTEAIRAINTKIGNCRVECSTYIGTGTSGSTGKASITFPEAPFLVILSNNNGVAYFLYQGMSYAVDSPQGNIYFSWSGNTVSWYANFGTIINSAGTAYRVIAFYSTEE